MNQNYSYYTQAVGYAEQPEPAIGQMPDPAIGALAPYGSYYGMPPEQLRYPDAAGNPQNPQFGYGDVTSHDMYPYGQDPTAPPAPGGPPPAPETIPPDVARKAKILGTVGTVLSLAGALSGAYHGYKRNRHAGWAFAWFLFGGALPIFSIPLSLAQGFAKPKGR